MTASDAALKIHFRQLAAMRMHERTRTDPGQIWVTLADVVSMRASTLLGPLRYIGDIALATCNCCGALVCSIANCAGANICSKCLGVDP